MTQMQGYKYKAQEVADDIWGLDPDSRSDFLL